MKKKQKTNRNIWIVFWLFTVAALWDTTLTIWNLSTVGFHFEANPFISGVAGAIIIKSLIVIFAYVVCRSYHTRSFSIQYFFMGFLTLCTVMQILAGSTHIQMIQDQANADYIQAYDDGSVGMVVNDQVFATYRPDPYSTHMYTMLVLGLMLWPLFFGWINLMITQWVTKNYTGGKR